jgi:hypothetical protein
MRHITGMWFGGAGEYSEMCATLLHQRLDAALSLLSGLQQPSQGEPEDQEYRRKMQAEYDDCIEDIVAGLTGREYVFGVQLVYPGEWIFLGNE